MGTRAFYTFFEDGIDYIEYIEQGVDHEVQVLKVYHDKLVEKNITSMEIPANVTDPKTNSMYTVVAVGTPAFKNCKTLKTIKLPDTISNISTDSFENCTSLESIEIPYQVTDVWGCFRNCTSLKTVKLPSGLKFIGSDTFKGCKTLSEINIPEGVEHIDQAAFSGCISLGTGENDNGTIVIPDSVTQIYESAFWGCTGLTNIKLPKNLHQVHSYVFRDCSNLRKVEIPSGVWQIGTCAFSGCTSLGMDSDRTVVIPDTVTSVQQCAFEKCKALEWITIPSQVTEISDQTFDQCSSLREVTLPAGLTTIGSFAFSDCVSLGTIKIPQNVTNFKRGAFRRCTGLNTMEIVIPSDREWVPITVEAPERPEWDVFLELPVKRSIVFLSDKDGSRLTGKALRQAQEAYLKAGESDGNAEDGLWYGWSVGELAEPVKTYTITASATEGGSIDPLGAVSVNEGEDKSFTITPDEGKKIKAVTVDDSDVTDKLADTPARVKAGARYYTFTNVTGDHTIHAEFADDGGGTPDPGPGPTPGPDPDPEPTPDPEPGPTPGPAPAPGPDPSPDPNPSANPDSGGGDSPQESAGGTANEQAAAASAAKPQAENGKEPKTGDSTPLEIYATVAMIAGLTYLLLCFMEESRGMSEREKEVFVAAFIRWAKKGGRFRKCCAIAAIFCLLVYYHAIGKQARQNRLSREYLRQAL